MHNLLIELDHKDNTQMIKLKKQDMQDQVTIISKHTQKQMDFDWTDFIIKLSF